MRQALSDLAFAGLESAVQTLLKQTCPWPRPIMPILLAAAFDKSNTRPLMNGPRSLMRTTTDLPLFGLVTFSLVPNGKVLCAAVSLAGFMRSPDAVLDVSAYQDAEPQPANAGAEKDKDAAIAADKMIYFMSSGLAH
jgi:hypothetical protein